MLTFLQAGPVQPPPTGDQVGPTVDNVAVAPGTVTSTGSATLTARASDTTTGGSVITRAEYVIDDQNVALGSGTQMLAVDGQLDTDTENVTATIASTVLSALTEGRHTVYVRASDAAGKWGAASSATFTVASTGPKATQLSLVPNPVNSGSVQLSATGDDSGIGGKVVTGEYFLDTQGANGTGSEVTVTNHATVTTGTATIGSGTVGLLPPGAHTVYVHFRDDTGPDGIWGPVSTVSLKIDRQSPSTTSVTVSPSTTDGSTGSQVDPASLRVHADFVDTAASGVSSAVVAAEGFFRTAGGNGTGFAFVADDTGWDSSTESGYGLIPLSQLTGLTDGSYPVYVHAKDAAGNWGPFASGNVVIYRGPAVTSAGLTSVSALAGPRTIATATAPAGIIAAEMFQGSDPGAGNGSALVITPSGATSVGIAADPRSIGVGNNRIVWVRAKDANGTWGKATAVTITVTGIFADGFESGSTSAWSSVTNATRLAVLKAAAIDGTWGLRVTAQTNNTSYLRRNFGATSTLHVKFNLDPQTFATPSGNAYVTVLQGASNNSQVFAVQLRNGSQGRQIRLVVGSSAAPWRTLGTGVSEIAVDRTAAGSNRPTSLTVNGGLLDSRTSGSSSPNNLRLGIVTATGSGNNNATRTTGYLYLDSLGATN
jgi:hypothetical protein